MLGWPVEWGFNPRQIKLGAGLRLLGTFKLLALTRPDLCQPFTKFATNGKSTVMLRFPDLIEVHIFFLNYDLSNSG